MIERWPEESDTASHDNGSDVGLDWEAARDRLASTLLRLDADGLPQERIDEILTARAVQFARVPEGEDEGERLDLMIVRLGTELYGLDAQLIFRVRPAVDIAYVPRVPSWVRGIVNERGRILSVIDLGRFLGLLQPADDAELPYASRSLVIVEIPEMELAFLADELLSVVSLPVSQIHDAPDLVRGIPATYARGVVSYRVLADHLALPPESDSEVTLVILNLRTLLTDERLIVEEQIA